MEGVLFFISLYMSLFLIENSDGLQCYNCQAAISESGEDLCHYSQQETCPPASTRCLSAKFSVSADSLHGQKVISALTCFPDMQGHECDFFLDRVQKSTPSPFKIGFYDKCKICSTDGCNSAPTNILSGSLFPGGIFVFCFIFFLICP